MTHTTSSHAWTVGSLDEAWLTARPHLVLGVLAARDKECIHVGCNLTAASSRWQATAEVVAGHHAANVETSGRQHGADGIVNNTFQSKAMHALSIKINIHGTFTPARVQHVAWQAVPARTGREHTRQSSDRCDVSESTLGATLKAVRSCPIQLR